MHKFSNRRSFIKSAIAFTGILGMYATTGYADAAVTAEPLIASTAPADRPNVLLILADDLGWSDLGCYGGEIKTPALDALANNGLRYTQFYNSARCCPSRAALLTGLNPHQAGVPYMNGPLNNQCVTIAEVLGAAGYNTYMVGKWHLGDDVNPQMRGFDEFYGMLGGFNTYWKEDPFQTRLPADRPKRPYAEGEYYATDAFGDYALDFLQQNEKSDKPWFMYLSFNAGHFPLHAPEDAIAKYEALYREKGWDAMREERLARQKKMGLVPADLKLPPHEPVPPNFINRQTGWADKPVPAWDTLDKDRQADLGRRMATYAATVDIMDQNIGRVVDHLKKTGQFENTIIFFLSDNGACAEWDPYGFDKLDSPLNILHKGEELKQIGAPDSYVSYGSGWANACDTPWRLYKHYTEEGGIRTPMVVHWPRGLKTKPGALTNQVGFLTDVMSTVVELCGATYPREYKGHPILPMEGESMVSAMQGKAAKARTLCIEHEGNRMVREGDWKLVTIGNNPWTLFDLAKDPTELNDLAAKEPARVARMEKNWNDWAVRCNVVKPTAESEKNPKIANRPLTIRCEAEPDAANSTGVLVAQGGDQQGYALHLDAGKPVFSVRRGGTLYKAAATEVPKGKFTLEAKLLHDGAMTLAVNGKVVAKAKAPGLIPTQPKDGFSTGEDTQSAVGSYTAPNRFSGKVTNVTVETGDSFEKTD